MVPSWVVQYIGIPFLSGGRDKNGCDCYGLVRLVLQEQFGYQLPLLSGMYKNANDCREIRELFSEHIPLLAGERIDHPEPGSVAIIRFRGVPVHVGIFVSDDTLLHVLDGINAHMLKRDSPNLRGGIEGIYRVDKSYCINPSLLHT